MATQRYSSVGESVWMNHNHNHPKDLQVTTPQLDVATDLKTGTATLQIVATCPGTNFGNIEEHLSLSVLLNHEQIHDVIKQLSAVVNNV